MRSISVLASLAPIVAANCLNIENMVTFGDSLTDEGRLDYWSNNDAKLPPPGEHIGLHNVTASGGLSWARMVANKMDIKSINYAVGGATCTKEIWTRQMPLLGNELFPSVTEDQIPIFQAEVEGFEEKVFGNRTAENTAYVIWIGANDINGYYFDAQQPGKTLTDYLECVWNAFDKIYETGGRQFFINNRFPNHDSPLYKPSFDGGMGNTWNWENKTSYNETQYYHKLILYSDLLNTAYAYGAPFQLLVQNRWPGATVTIFDAWMLMQDVIDNAEEKYSKYFDSPINKLEYFMHTNATETTYEENFPFEEGYVKEEPWNSKELGKFLWFDEIHPSQNFLEVVANEYVEVLAGKSKYTTTYESKKE